jgi:hypothetical protein
MEGDGENIITCKIISTKGQEHILEIQNSATFLELKNKIIQEVDIFKSPSEFYLILSGRAIKNENVKISSVVETPTVTFFINSSAVHAGCCRDFNH